MRTSKGRLRVLALSGLVAVWAALAYACGSDDENPAVDRNRATGDGGGEGSVNPNGNPPTPPNAFCGKYGGYENVKSMAATILTKAQADCRIQHGFDGMDQGAQQHLLECFQVQLGNAFHCDGITYVAGQTKDSKGNACRSMSEAHSSNNMPQNYKLRLADYNAFLDAVASTFNAQNGATKEDLQSLATFFEGQKANIVQSNSQPDRNAYCPTDNSCTTCKAPDAAIIDSGNDTGNDSGNDGGSDAPADG